MIIEAKGIEKSFGTLKVLKGVDFQAERGEVVAIMGASGAGKSTLLQILGTLSTPDAGTLTVDGTDVLHLGQRELSAFRNRRIGFVFQAHHLLPEFDALENVTIPALIGGIPMRAAREKATRLLGEVGLSERLSHKPSELSGGEQQRVAIARALVNDPAILFADEPSGNPPTSPPATWTARPRRKSTACSSTSATAWARPSSSSRTIPPSRPSATAPSSCETVSS